MRQNLSSTLVGLILAFALCASAATPLPGRISDPAFEQLIDSWSEPGGAFQSDNLTSNEMGLQAVLPVLEKQIRPGGVYLGVGPEQNFTYIAALRPRIAFIIDIRRGNLLLQLMYKALFEMSGTRADFLSRLFSRPPAPRLSEQSTSSQLMNGFVGDPGSEELFQRDLAELLDRLSVTHRYHLNAADRAEIERIYRAFRVFGPEISQSIDTGAISAAAGKVPGMPTYQDLMTAATPAGTGQSYLANEERYRFVRRMEQNNLIIPLTGDFGGPKTIRAIGQYLKKHDAAVSAFYCSNVEEYLFGGYGNVNGGWQRFYANVASLPMDDASVFIRSAGAYHARDQVPGSGSEILARIFQTPNMISSMRAVLSAVKAGHIHNFGDVLALSR